MAGDESFGVSNTGSMSSTTGTVPEGVDRDSKISDEEQVEYVETILSDLLTAIDQVAKPQDDVLYDENSSLAPPKLETLTWLPVVGGQ